MICTQPPLDVCGIGRIVAAAASAAGYGKGGEGWPHALLVVLVIDGDDNCNGDCLSKKEVEQGKRRGGIERSVCFFPCCLILLLFFGLPFSMQVE
jgi:hypothetical protein